MTAGPSAVSWNKTVDLVLGTDCSGFPVGYAVPSLRGEADKQMACSYVSTPPLARTKPFLMVLFLICRVVSVRAWNKLILKRGCRPTGFAASTTYVK